MSPAEVKRIAIYGPESTGKSWLAEKLATHFGEPCAPEFVRSFWESHEGRIVGADLGEIAKGQIAGEEIAAVQAKRVVFCDTELLTNVLWADLLFPGECPGWVREEAELRCRRYTAYLLCDTDVPFAIDPQRSFPDTAGREMCRRLWCETLESRGLPVIEVRGTWAEREQIAIAAVQRLLGHDGSRASGPMSASWDDPGAPA